MNIKFNIDLENSMFEVLASYKNNEIRKSKFILNRDFIVEEITCDCNNINIDESKSLVNIDGYIANNYMIPKNITNLIIKYKGTLDGTTGLCPYVRETINEKFTFIRFETFCYPIFADNDEKDVLSFIRKNMLGEVEIIVPQAYLVLSPSKLLSEESVEDKIKYKFDGSSMNFAISKYQLFQTLVGDFYLLNDVTDDMKEMITKTLSETYYFLNENFGERIISSQIKFVTIPHRFGSFATPTCIFIDEEVFQDKSKMGSIIHEFIHLGWNAQTDDNTQRIRFFDEAFTNYLTLRVLEYLLGTDLYKSRIEKFKEIAKEQFREKQISISEYGKYQCGDFSYTIGALCLNELSSIVGRKTFDDATKTFLEKYKDSPVSIEGFCKEYIKLCNNSNLKYFFEEWIYTTKGVKKLLNI